MNRSTFWMIKYMNGSIFSKARYMNGVGFEILARTPVPKFPSKYASSWRGYFSLYMELCRVNLTVLFLHNLWSNFKKIVQMFHR